MENEKNNNEVFENKKPDIVRDEIHNQIDNVVMDYKESQEMPKRKRGRPRKNADEGIPARHDAPVAALWTAENTRPLAELPFYAGVIATGYDGWKLDDVEAETLSKPLANVMNEYVGAGKYASIIALSTALLVVVSKKYSDYNKYKKENKDDDKPKS